MRRRVLLADDNTLVGEVLVVTLAPRLAGGPGHQRRRRPGAGRQAQQQEQPYEAVLMDWRMPDGDGLLAARQLRERQADNRPKVIMLTGFGRDFLTEAQTERRRALRRLPDQAGDPGADRREVVGARPGRRDPAGVHAAAVVDESHRLAGACDAGGGRQCLNRQVAAELLLARVPRWSWPRVAWKRSSGVLSGAPLDVVIMDIADARHRRPGGDPPHPRRRALPHPADPGDDRQSPPTRSRRLPGRRHG